MAMNRITGSIRVPEINVGMLTISVSMRPMLRMQRKTGRKAKAG